MDYWGFVDGASGLQVTHPEAIRFIPYPYAAGDIHSDSLEFEFMASGLNVFRRQILEQEVLESGTLTLPNELSFEGALRVDARQSVYDSTVTGSTEILIVGEMYWVQDMPLPVAQTYDYYQIVGGGHDPCDFRCRIRGGRRDGVGTSDESFPRSLSVAGEKPAHRGSASRRLDSRHGHSWTGDGPPATEDKSRNVGRVKLAYRDGVFDH